MNTHLMRTSFVNMFSNLWPSPSLAGGCEDSGVADMSPYEGGFGSGSVVDVIGYPGIYLSVQDGG